MKVIVVIIVFLAGCIPAAAQTITSLADNPDDGCRIKLEKIRSEIEARHKKYEFNAREYSEGLFCSECGRTKSEIEERAHISFEQHIRDGVTHNRRALIATQKMYDDLYVEYLADFNELKKEYDNKYYDCGGDNASTVLPTITDEQFRLFKVELGGVEGSVYGTQLWPVRTQGSYYDAWLILRITTITWRTTTNGFTRIITSGYQQSRNERSENAIFKAGDILNEYLKKSGIGQPVVLPGTETWKGFALK